MWSTSEEPPGTMEGESTEAAANAKEKCEQNKSQLESLKEIMLKNKQNLKKKEEEVQEYARRLSKIKSRAKLSRRSKEEGLPCKNVTRTSETSLVDTSDDAIDDISQAKTAKAKSTLLQKKLAENRKVFEQRSKEITETKRAVEEKVEAIKQQLEEQDVAAMSFQKDQLTVAPVKPVMITSDIMSPIQIESIKEKDNTITTLQNRILELEATIVDLQENLKEKDSVIESKTKAVTLMSADLSKKGKTTLDTLEDTKDEMRTMQKHFVLLETSLRNKNESLLAQLQERDSKIAELEGSIDRFEQQVEEQKLSESASADFSRSTMDTLIETKEAMKSMQENFVLIESSLKAKNENLLQQLEEKELKLAEANERIFKLESGIGIVKDPTVEELQFKLDKLEQSNKQLQDEKYQLQKSVAELQDRILNSSVHGNSALIEKDNRIVELENLIEELKQSNKLLEEESKAELQQKLADLTLKNEEYLSKIANLESQVHELEEEKNDFATKVSGEATLKEDEKVAKLTKELEELNKSMIKIKAQHRSKVKSLQKQLENFKKISDTNAELVRLANQVALLEEEKASAIDWQERVVDLESKVSAQTKECEMQVEAIAALENQKLDLMQELHIAKQEISSLEAEIAESENLRVTAEMKVVDLEEQLDAVHKVQVGSKSESSSEVKTELMEQVEALTQENSELKSKLEEKGTSEAGSTESFEAIQELDKSDLLKKIEDLLHKNNDLTLKLSKFQKENVHTGSTEWLETINEGNKSELLAEGGNDLTMKLSRIEEKGSSDTGSTESFERIPEHTESMTKIELLTQENNELVVKLTKLEERLKDMEPNNEQSFELSELKTRVTDLTDEKDKLEKQIELLTIDSDSLTALRAKLEEYSPRIESETYDSERAKRDVSVIAQKLIEDKNALEKQVQELRGSVEQSRDMSERDQIEELSVRIEELLKENENVLSKLSELEAYNQRLKENLTEVTEEKEELQTKLDRMIQDSSNDKLEKLETQEEIPQLDEPLSQQTESMIVASLEREIEECKKLIAEQTGLIEEMRMKLASKEDELEEKDKQIVEFETSGKKTESLEDELKDMFNTVDEWKHKNNEMQQNMERLEAEKASIEEGLRLLQSSNELLSKEKEEMDAENKLLKQQLQDTTTMLESKVHEQLATISEKENEIVSLQQSIEDKDQELHAKYSELQNKMIIIDSLQDECNNCKMLIKEKDDSLTSMRNQLISLDNTIKSKEDEICILRKEINVLNEKMAESKPLKDYNELLEQLKDKDMMFDELHCRINATTKENSNLSEKLKSLSQQNNNLQSQLIDKQKEVADLVDTRVHLEAQISEVRNEKDNAERRLWELQSIVDNNSKFVDDLQTELRDCYKKLEQLKEKHTEDVELQNQRLENMIEELHSKAQECETLKSELREKEQLIGENITEEVKATLEARVVDLEQKLKDAEDKIQMQLEKMKKIAANLKKKTTVCQELESRVAELEEKWTTEKDEKEAKNKQIQDVEIAIREKDNRIVDLEEKLMQARNENAESFKHIDDLTTDLANSKEKITLLSQQIQEMEQEINRLRTDLETSTMELANEKEIKHNIVTDYESYKQWVVNENERKQSELEEVKEKARELSVRMQVMETEYVEQLALIKNLKAENGLLMSKQTQINEKLENVEKESEERRLLIKGMQKVTTDATTETVQIAEEEKVKDSPSCDHCEQCQTLVKKLEAELEEREAVMRNRSLEDPYNDLQLQYNALLSSHEEVKAQLSEALKENKELIEKIEQLQSSNVTQEVTEQTSSGQVTDSLNFDLAKKCEEQEAELLNLQREVQAVQRNASELQQLLKSAEDTKNSLQQEVESLRSDRDVNNKTILDLRTELEEYKNQNTESVEKSVVKRETGPDQLDDAPQLFDASKIFGATFASDSDLLTENETKRYQTLLNEKEAQCSNLTQEINHLQKLMSEEQAEMSQRYNQSIKELETVQKQLEAVQVVQEEYKQLLSEKDVQIDELNAELWNLSLPETKQDESTKDVQLEELRASLNSTKKSLEQMIVERDQQSAALKSYEQQINNLEEELRNLSACDRLQDMENYVSGITIERDLLQLQLNDLTRSMEELKDSMGAKIENLTREKDEAKELAARVNLTFAETPTEALNLEEKVVQLESNNTLANVTHEDVKQDTSLEISVDDGKAWDPEKLNVDDETWGWDSDDTQLIGEPLTPSLIPNTEMQLRARVEDLEDQIKLLEKDRVKLLELRNENATMKKQLESLQRQLKTQKSSDFYGLDSAIEEELKAQIDKLEKSLSEIRDEQKHTVAEKEALTRRLDVVVSANERYMEMKERQDMDMEVLRIRNKELSEKLEALNKQEGPDEVIDVVQKEVTVPSEESKPDSQQRIRKRSVEPEDYETQCQRYKFEIDELKDEIEALATENEMLQHFVQEQKVKLSTSESKRTSEENESIQIVDDLNKKISEQQTMLSKSKEEYELLRKQYEQCLMDANDQVTVMRQNTDFLKEEAQDKINKLEMEIVDLRQQLETSELSIVELQRKLQEVYEEKKSLEERLTDLTASSERQLSSLNASMAEVTDLLNVRIQEVADLKQELQRQYTNHEDAKMKLQETIEELRQEVSEKKQQLESLKQSMSNKEDELIQQQSVETVSALVSQATQELVQKHAIEIEEKEKQIQDLNEKLLALEETVNRYSMEKQNSVEQLESQQQELELLKQNLMEKNSIVESFQVNFTSMREELIGKQQELSGNEETVQRLARENQKYLETIEILQQRLRELEAISVDSNELQRIIKNLESSLMEKETILTRYAQESNEYNKMLEANEIEITELRMEMQQIGALRNELIEKTEQMNSLAVELEATRKDLEKTKQTLSEKTCLLEKCDYMLNEKEIELEKSSSEQDKRSNIVDSLPVFKMADDNYSHQQAIDAMQAELEKKQEEIEHLKYVLNENTYPGIIREMQDAINCLYDEKAELKSEIEQKQKQIDDLTQCLEASSKEETNQLSKEQEVMEIVRLQNELHAKEQEINELRNVVESRETEINTLKKLLEDKAKEYELIQNVLEKDVSIGETSTAHGEEASGETNKTSTSQELDLALYMLHQRDVRCEELTHELMQLLEERDTLQLRLSNAIRVNEELRSMSASDGSKTEASFEVREEPHVEYPSPSKSKGPVEIAKEAVDTPIGEDKETLAKKLSQLQTVSHAKDVRLKDERELRHTQQMSLLAHKDILSTLPPEAAAKLVSANYTLSRDVQSQTSVLLNWLWGKSTPKVVHM